MVVLLAAIFAVVGVGLGWPTLRSRIARVAATPAVAPPHARAAPAAAPADPPGTLRDPLSPAQLVALDSTARADAGSWVNARPGFQYSHTAAERGGVEPCAGQAVDTSAFSDWHPLAMGHFSALRDGALDATGAFDLVIHFHGDEPVRRELALSGQHFVLYTLTLEPGQSYAQLFTGTGLFKSIVAELTKALGQRAAQPAHARHIVLSAWSAGFTGVESILAQPEGDRAEAAILIDGLHAARDRYSFEAQLKPFLDYAKRAAAGERFFFVSHSSIDPSDFASTTETAHYLISALGGAPLAVRRADPFGLELVEYFSLGDFHVRGYAGNDKADHCAQLALLRTAFSALGRRWGTL